MELKDKVQIIEQVFKEKNLHSLTYKGACLEIANRVEQAINYNHVRHF